MTHYIRLVGVALVLFIISAFAIAPASASAFWEGFPFSSPGKGNSPAQEKVLSNLPFKFCERTISAAGISIKFNLPSKKCDPTPPPPPPDEDEPTLTFTANPTTIQQGATSTLTWDSTHADSCTASGGWSGSKALDGTQIVSPTATTTYTLECENDEGEVTKSVTVNVIPEGPVPPAPTLDFSASTSTIMQGATSTLSWTSANTSSCTASGGWSGAKTLVGSQQVNPTATTTYTLTCENDEDDEVVKNVTVNVIVPQEEPEGALLITEVLYDLNLSTTSPQGAESANEWVEIYNGTNASIDLGDYFIADAIGSDALPNVMLPAGAFAVITASSTTASFWDIPAGAVVIVLSSNIGSNGLGNTGDAVFLYDSASSTVDSVSWGTNTAAFDPSVTGVPTNSGHSIARIDNEVDTNTAADWEHRETPTPGE